MTNIMGSPKLTGLFTALQIDDEFPLLPPPVDTLDEARDPSLDSEHGEIRPEHISSSHDSTHTTTLAKIRVNKSGDSTGSKRRVFVDKNSPINVYFKEWIGFAEKSVNPLSEISPFPTTIRSGSALSALTRWNPNKPMHLRIADFEGRLEKLEKFLPPNSPAVICAVQQLGKILLEVGQTKRAEGLYLRSALAKQKQLGTEHPDTVMEYLKIIECRSQSGEHKEAFALHQKLHAKVLEVFGPESELGITSISIMAGILYHLGRKQESEELHRLSLQLALSYLGRKHPLVPSIMADLGVILWFNHTNAIAACEQLVREGFSVECYLHGGPDKVPLYVFGGLAWILPLAGHHDEAAQLHRKQIRRSWQVEGIEHTATLINLRRLGKALRMKGDLINSEPKSTISLIWCLRLQGPDHRQTADALEEVTWILEALELWDEATVRAEQLWVTRVKALGFGVPEMQKPTDLLRNMYTMQGLYKDVRDFDRRLDWVRQNVKVMSLLTEKSSRKWRRYEADLEPEEKETQISKKRCVRYSNAEEDDGALQYETGQYSENYDTSGSGYF
jgi:hypothetical protein